MLCIHAMRLVNHYELLDVAETATPDEIKKAYRQLCMVWHPDRFGTTELKAKAESKIKEINVAYDVLSNSEKRREHDGDLRRSRSHNPRPETESNVSDEPTYRWNAPATPRSPSPPPAPRPLRRQRNRLKSEGHGNDDDSHSSGRHDSGPGRQFSKFLGRTVIAGVALFLAGNVVTAILWGNLSDVEERAIAPYFLAITGIGAIGIGAIAHLWEQLK